MAIVPIAAMVLSKAERIKLSQFGTDFSIELALPFSWIAFYLAACSFSIATAIYSIFCPPIVRDYRGFADFVEEGRNVGFLHEAFIHALAYRERSEPPGLKGKTFSQTIGMDYDDLLITKFNYEFLEPTVDESEVSEHKSNVYLQELDASAWQQLAKGLMESRVVFKTEKQKDAFWYVRNLADTTFTTWRWTCMMAYLTGFVFIWTVLLQNFCFVFSKLLYR